MKLEQPSQQLIATTRNTIATTTKIAGPPCRVSVNQYLACVFLFFALFAVVRIFEIDPSRATTSVTTDSLTFATSSAKELAENKHQPHQEKESGVGQEENRSQTMGNKSNKAKVEKADDRNLAEEEEEVYVEEKLKKKLTMDPKKMNILALGNETS